jgi:hypothetical protein
MSSTFIEAIPLLFRVYSMDQLYTKLFVIYTYPGQNSHGRKQSYTENYDDLHVIVYYNRISPCPYTESVTFDLGKHFIMNY